MRPLACAKHVPGGTFFGHQCRNKPVVQVDDKWYCSVHKPGGSKDRRREQRELKWKAARKYDAYQHALGQWSAKCSELVEAVALGKLDLHHTSLTDRIARLYQQKPRKPS